MNKHEGMPDPEKIPGLLKELSGVLYSTNQAKQFGVAIATFYRELKDGGMTDEQAYELTCQYMSTLNLGQMIKGFGHHKGKSQEDD